MTADQSPDLVTALRKAAEHPYKGPNDTDSTMLLHAAVRLDGGYPAGGSNTQQTVARLLRAVVAILDAHPTPAQTVDSRPTACPDCDGTNPLHHPMVGGEVQPCRDTTGWHTPREWPSGRLVDTPAQSSEPDPSLSEVIAQWHRDYPGTRERLHAAWSRPTTCPDCDGVNPLHHPMVGGEVQPCRDTTGWHTPREWPSGRLVDTPAQTVDLAGALLQSIDDHRAHPTPAQSSEQEVVELREVLADLVRLKDGPRDDNYRASKEASWEAARTALATTTGRNTP